MRQHLERVFREHGEERERSSLNTRNSSDSRSTVTTCNFLSLHLQVTFTYRGGTEGSATAAYRGAAHAARPIEDSQLHAPVVAWSPPARPDTAARHDSIRPGVSPFSCRAAARGGGGYTTARAAGDKM